MHTIIDLFESSVARFADNPYLHEKQGDTWIQTSYRETHDQVVAFGAGLLGLGLSYGDRVALLSEGRNAWIISELGLLYTGACSVPLSIKLSPAELLFRIEHSGARMLIVSNTQLAKINQIRTQLKSLTQFILLDRESPRQEGDLYFDEILVAGEGLLKEQAEALTKAMKAVHGDSLANITYTSGTTADPKGVMLTHSNYVVNVQQSLTLMDIPPTYRTLAILPWDHCFAHTACLYCFMAKGASVASVQAGKTGNETLKNIPKNISEIKPNLLMSVPALSKTFRKSIESGIAKKGKFVNWLFNLGLRTAYAHNDMGINRGKGWRILLKPLYSLFDKVLFAKVRQGFGGELDFFIGGGALLDSELQRFFLAIGMPVCQGYGLSESSPVISSNSLKNLKIGTSGKLVKPLDLKILGDDGQELPPGVNGQIVIRGGNVMKGYWKNPSATAETIKDGWLYTGDLGYMDQDDYLVVIGRVKSLLIANDGEKYSPEAIEETLIEVSPFIDQCMLHNNQHAFTVALIVPNIQAINRACIQHHFKPGSDEAFAFALKLIAKDIAQSNKQGKHANMFPDRWLPSRFYILPEAFTEQNNLMNSTMKMVRGKVTEKYASVLELLHSPAGKGSQTETNILNLRRWFDEM